MSTQSQEVVLFELDDTLASMQESAAQGGRKQFDVYAKVRPRLEVLHRHGARLGVLFDEGISVDEVKHALDGVRVCRLFASDLIIPISTQLPRRFEQASARVLQALGSRDPAPALLYVSGAATRRVHARAADLLTAPHPVLAMSVLLGRGPLRYLRIRVPPRFADTEWEVALQEHALVPLHVSAEPVGKLRTRVVYAIADPMTAAWLDDFGFWVDRLGEDDEPQTTDLYILRDDRQVESQFGTPAGNSQKFFGHPPSARRVLASTHEGLVVAMPAGRSVESYHFVGTRHGHNRKLLPSMALLGSEREGSQRRLTDRLDEDPSVLASTLTQQETEVLEQSITGDGLKREIERYTGIKEVSKDTRILSRHIHHVHNKTAVDALQSDLNALGGLDVQLRCFEHEGCWCANVEATMTPPLPDRIVIVSAHLDSTGKDDPRFCASNSAAPGADDDASGIAGVLCAARALLALDKTVGGRKHGVRFLLFNAEEQGLVGSRDYAAKEAARRIPIAAVLQMDMIGYNATPRRTYELHAGCYSRPNAEERAIWLTQLVDHLARRVSRSLGPAQLYPEPGTLKDPAESFSDHSSFLEHGYTACVASEDFHYGPEGEPADANPHYHKQTDEVKEIDEYYAADIARAVAAAAWIMATR
jgi:hypothetical protein